MRRAGVARDSSVAGLQVHRTRVLGIRRRIGRTAFWPCEQNRHCSSLQWRTHDVA